MQQQLGFIKQQSEDLREELKELDEWEGTMEKLLESHALKKNKTKDENDDVPIRGTVPSIKESLIAKAKESGKKLPADQDPIQIAKDRGNEYFRVGNIADAIHSYTSGIDLDPLSSTTHVLYGNRAMCYIKLEKWNEAEKDATTCVQMNRGYAKGYFRRAIARKNLGKLKEARSDLESVLALVPDDASAKTEMDVVTKMLQIQREKEQGLHHTTQKKKIMIEEVEDDDDEEDEGNDKGEKKEVAGVNQAPPKEDEPKVVLSAEEEKTRNDRIQSHMHDLEQARREVENKGRENALREEKVKDERRRYNARVEIIEEDDDTQPKSVVQEVEPRTQAPEKAHVDPVGPAEPEISVPAPTDGGKSTETVRRSRSRPAKATLTPPKSFTEFERVFSDVEDDDELRNYYVGLLNPSGLPSLFGSNLTPEILLGLLKSVKEFSGSVAFDFLRGISKINRVEDITLFFSPSEKSLLGEVIDVVKSGGVPEKEVMSIKKKLHL